MSVRTARRREQLARGFKADGIEGLLVLSEPNVRYLTGFEGDSSSLVVLRDRAVLVSDGRYAEQIRLECPDVETYIRPVEQLMIPAIGAVIGRLGITRLGFEAAHLSVAQLEEFAARPCRRPSS